MNTNTNPLLFQLQHTFWKVMDLLFPPSCAGCGNFLSRFCPACYHQINLCIHSNPCQKCGNPMVQGKCIDCFANHFVIDGIKSWGFYQSSLKQAVIQLKFHRNLALGDEFAPILKKMITLSNWHIDLIIPVPISNQRYLERGYNQASVLALPLSFSLSIPFSTKALIKHRESRSQIGLSFYERMINIQDSFRANPKLVEGKNILIVDDVITTGATLNSCAQALLNVGAASVFGISLAKTISHHI